MEREENCPCYLDFYTSTTHIAPFLLTGLESSADTLPLGGSDTHCLDGKLHGLKTNSKVRLKKPPLNDKHHGLNEMLQVLSKISMIKLKTPWLNANLFGLNENLQWLK